jgi:hypothetical protein
MGPVEPGRQSGSLPSKFHDGRGVTTNRDVGHETEP